MTITPPILTKYELVRAISILANAVSNAIDGYCFDYEIRYSHPILAAIDLFENLRPGILEVRREIIPYSDKLVERFDVAEMEYNEVQLDEIRSYLLDNLVDPNEIVQMISGETKIKEQERRPGELVLCGTDDFRNFVGDLIRKNKKKPI